MIVLVMFLAGLSWYSFVFQILYKIPFGMRPALNPVVIGVWVLFGIGFPVLFLKAGLVTEVRIDGIYIRYFPFHRIFRTMPFDAIRNCEIATYRPFRDYGGRGVRYGVGTKAYIVSGNRGVRLDLYSGSRILLGSQRPEELNHLIDTLKRKI